MQVTRTSPTRSRSASTASRASSRLSSSSSRSAAPWATSNRSPYLEAIRQFRNDAAVRNVLYIHLTLLPRVATGELKTKPTQHSVKELRSIGIQPDVLIARADEPIEEELREKIALFCDVKTDNVISEPNAWSIYAVPLMLEEAGLGRIVVEELGLKERAGEPDLVEWRFLVDRIRNARIPLTIGLVGKYIECQRVYVVAER